MICTTALLIQTEETKETDSDVRWRPLGTPTAWWCRTWGRGRVTNFEWRRKIDMASVPRAKQWPPEWWKKVSDCFTTRWTKIMSFVQKPPQDCKKTLGCTFFALTSLFYRTQNYWKALAKNKAQQHSRNESIYNSQTNVLFIPHFRLLAFGILVTLVGWFSFHFYLYEFFQLSSLNS